MKVRKRGVMSSLATLVLGSSAPQVALWSPVRPVASLENFDRRHRRDRRQPAARASASVQNQRSPRDGLMRVLS